MILASCTENDAGLGAKGAHAVISFAEGGIRFALHSSSLVSVFHMISSSTRSSMRTVSALRAYIPPTAPVEGTWYTLQGLVAWKDIIRSLEMQYAALGFREESSIRTSCTAHPARLLFRQVLFSVMRQLLSPHPQTNALSSPIRALFKPGEETAIPHIVITPPPDVPSHQASINMVPTPQDAAFGNQLTVPDPEFTVINCWKAPEFPFSDTFQADEYSSVSDNPLAWFGGCPSSSWGDPEETDDAVKCMSWEENGEDGPGTLGLGPTWSG